MKNLPIWLRTITRKMEPKWRLPWHDQVYSKYLVKCGSFDRLTDWLINWTLLLISWLIYLSEDDDSPTQLGTWSVGCQVPVRSQWKRPAVCGWSSTERAGTKPRLQNSWQTVSWESCVPPVWVLEHISTPFRGRRSRRHGFAASSSSSSSYSLEHMW